MKMIIGLTGRTGSGKSSAADFFREMGACVVDCDSVAHSVLEYDEVKKALRESFSDDIFDESGSVVRSRLGAIVFSSPEKLRLLNSIVHPAINEAVLNIIEKSDADIAVIDGSELDTSGIDKKCSHIIVITAPREVRLKRIMERDGICEADALRRIDAQHDYSGDAIIVDNNSDTEHLRKQLKQITGENNV